MDDLQGQTHLDKLKDLAGDYAASWREVVRERRHIPQDLMASLTVAAVALPLNIGLAIASGMPPIAGLIAGAIGGALVAIFGSSNHQVGGVAAALSVMVFALAQEFGPSGVAAATVWIGIVEIALALALAGRAVKFVPESVLAGFTTGVGLKLLDQQIPHVLGLPEPTPSTAALVLSLGDAGWVSDIAWGAAFGGAFVIALLFGLKRFTRFPTAVVGIAVVTVTSLLMGWGIPTIGEVPSAFPAPSIPHVLDGRLLELVARATPLAFLAAAESLLSARAIDRLARATKPHDPNVELVGQGVANLAAGFFSGMPITGVIARSSVNVHSGAKTRVSAFGTAVLLACSVLFLGRYLGHVPIAALAGLLCVVGLRLVEVKTLVRFAREERVEAVAFLVAAIGTMSGYMMTGLVGGLVIHFGARLVRSRAAAAAEPSATDG